MVTNYWNYTFSLESDENGNLYHKNVKLKENISKREIEIVEDALDVSYGASIRYDVNSNGCYFAVVNEIKAIKLGKKESYKDLFHLAFNRR